jgi:hypothetical protein
MKQYFSENVRVIVEDNKCEFTIPIDFAIILNAGDVLFPMEEGITARWVIDSENLDIIEYACVKIKEKFFTLDSIMVFATLA